METKILFADIDGTLLNDQKEIPKENMTEMCIRDRVHTMLFRKEILISKAG